MDSRLLIRRFLANMDGLSPLAAKRRTGFLFLSGPFYKFVLKLNYFIVEKIECIMSDNRHPTVHCEQS